MLMNSFLLKIAMLVMFLLAVTFGWAALVMVFPISLWNILLGIVAAFFLLRAFELADKINKLGPYAEEDVEEDTPPKPKHSERETPEESPEEE
jgi:fatty acid desaturase